MSSESLAIVHHVIWNGRVLFVQCISTCVMVIPHRINITRVMSYLIFTFIIFLDQNQTRIRLRSGSVFLDQKYQIFNIDARLQIEPKILYIEDRNHFKPIRDTFYPLSSCLIWTCLKITFWSFFDVWCYIFFRSNGTK